jgi:catechol 2,3-dioxygenase-like lactoylglutathione lyase family enzyme
MKKLEKIQTQITFLYYADLAPIVPFYQDVLGLELVEDQGWAKIYRVGRDAFVGLVGGDKGFHRPQETNAVLITLVVNDVPAWYDYLQGQGVTMLSELKHSEEIQIRGFFFQDPGGYTFEIQQFRKPELAEIFHGSES